MYLSCFTAFQVISCLLMIGYTTMHNRNKQTKNSESRTTIYFLPMSWFNDVGWLFEQISNLWLRNVLCNVVILLSTTCGLQYLQGRRNAWRITQGILWPDLKVIHINLTHILITQHQYQSKGIQEWFSYAPKKMKCHWWLSSQPLPHLFSFLFLYTLSHLPYIVYYLSHLPSNLLNFNFQYFWLICIYAFSNLITVTILRMLFLQKKRSWRT